MILWDRAMFAVVGPGAMGTLLAARFLEAGLPVGLVARDARRARALRRAGLELDGELKRRFEPARLAFVAPGARPAGPVELVCICVKSRDTAAAIAAARPFVGPETIVLSLQNGLDHARLLRRAFGRRAVLGVAHAGARSEGPGKSRWTGGEEIFLGRGPDNEPALKSARRLLAAAGWKVTVSADETRLLWTKLILNAAINPLGALSRRPNGELASTPALKDLMLQAAREGALAARRAGVRPLRRRMDLAALELCRRTGPNLNSMFQDLEAGRPTEASAILDPLLAAIRPGEAPVLRGLRGFIAALESGR